MLSSSLEGAAADGPIPPFCSGPAHHASLWLLLDVERPSSRPAEPPLLGAESAPRLEFAALGSWKVQACFIAALLLPRRSSLGEAANGLLWFPVPNNLLLYFSSPSTGTFARWVWLVLLEDLLEQDKALVVFIELFFELP